MLTRRFGESERRNRHGALRGQIFLYFLNGRSCLL